MQSSAHPLKHDSSITYEPAKPWLWHKQQASELVRLQVSFLTLQVKRLNNSLIVNARLPGYVNLTSSPYVVTFQVHGLCHFHWPCRWMALQSSDHGRQLLL